MGKQSKNVHQVIDQAIKEIWCHHIKSDYENFNLLKEDTLKNSFYYHLRTKLTDAFLEKNHLKIYTEFYHDGLRADLVIAKLCDEPGNNGHLQNDIVDILAVVEMKYKYGTNVQPFKEDIMKVKKYIKNLAYTNCLYYLAFIYEVEVGNAEFSWLTKHNLRWASGRVTELNGYFIENHPAPVFEVVSYNNL